MTNLKICDSTKTLQALQKAIPGLRLRDNLSIKSEYSLVADYFVDGRNLATLMYGQAMFLASSLNITEFKS
jgi:hypothetical protein